MWIANTKAPPKRSFCRDGQCRWKLPTSTAASVSTATTAAAAISTAVVAAAAEIVARALFHRTGLVDRKSTTTKVLSVPELNRLLGVFVRRHLHETESLGATTHAIHDDSRRLNGSGLGEGLAKFVFRRRVRKTTHIKLLCHASVVVPIKCKPNLSCRWSKRRGA